MTEHKITHTAKEKMKALNLESLSTGVSLLSLLKRPEITMNKVQGVYPEIALYGKDAIEQVEIAAKYEGYIKRQMDQVERFREYESVLFPDNINFEDVPSISSEVREKLIKTQPRSLGQAGRIQGVTPAALAVMHVYLKKYDRNTK